MPADFFFNDTATTEIYTLSLHDALPIGRRRRRGSPGGRGSRSRGRRAYVVLWSSPEPLSFDASAGFRQDHASRSEEHTSELQSRQYLVCRLLLEKTTSPASSGCSLRPNR